MTTRILIGDVRTTLAQLPDESVHCVVTSPPYFGLRDYGHAGQIGLEATPDAYVAELVEVFREVRRVLRSDGTFWLNLGDSYASDSKWGGSTGGKHAKGLHGTTESRSRRTTGLADKQRLMIPARVALALQNDGWWIRDEIVWRKPNPMPVSVTDRTTPAHEMLYMFSKSPRYRYDMDAIKEPIAESSRRRYAQPSIAEQKGGAKSDAYENAGVTRGSRRPNQIVAALAESDHGEMRQPRSVWSVATRPFKGAHFATFPPDLIRPCILAGLSGRGNRARSIFRRRHHGLGRAGARSTGGTASLTVAAARQANRLRLNLPPLRIGK